MEPSDHNELAKAVTDSLAKSYVFDESGESFGRFHTLAVDKETQVFRVIGVTLKPDLRQAILLPWEGCKIIDDAPERKVIVSKTSAAILQAQRIQISKGFEDDSPDPVIENALNQIIKDLLPKAPPWRELDLVNRLNRNTLTASWLRAVVQSAMSGAREYKQLGVRLNVPERLFDAVVVILNEAFGVGYTNRVHVQDPFRDGLLLELNCERPPEFIPWKGSPPLTPEDREMFRKHLARLNGQGA